MFAHTSQKNLLFISRTSFLFWLTFTLIFDSIFDSIKEKNILVEGWTDHQLLRIALSSIPGDYKNSLKAFNAIGVCYADGLKTIESLCGMLDLIPRKYIVLSDSDAPADDQKKKFEKNREKGIWLKYDDIYKNRAIITSEDFIMCSHLVEAYDKSAKENGVNVEITVQYLEAAQMGRLKAIRDELARNKVDKELSKEIIATLKKAVFIDMKQTWIENDYYEFLERLLNIIEV